MGEKNRAEPTANFVNRLRSLRTAKGLSQAALASLAGVTRQAVYAIEANQYLPTTAVALRLAGALDCRVEDLFSLVSAGEVIEGDLIGSRPLDRADHGPVRVKVARVGERIVVRPVAELGGALNYAVPADGLVIGTPASARRSLKGIGRVQVQLLRDRRIVEEEIVVAGCDPAIFLVGEYLRRRHEKATVVGWTMGSAAALEALMRREVHIAGLHMLDTQSGESNLPYLRRHLKGSKCTVVTFAAWQQGLLVRHGNPKTVRDVADLARKDLCMINRESGSGARLLVDQKLAAAGIRADRVKGYRQVASSHLEVARLIAGGMADVGIGVRSAAWLFGLGFIPLQEERYDLVIPTPYFHSHPSIPAFLDTIVTRAFRAEIEALGGYNTKETGRIVDWKAPRAPHPS